MRFGLDADPVATRAMASAFAAGHAAPYALDRDEHKKVPVETLRAAAALGMAGITVREDAGGSGLSRIDASPIFEARAPSARRLPRSCRSTTRRPGSSTPSAARISAAAGFRR